MRIFFPLEISDSKYGASHVVRNAGGSAEATLRGIIISQQFLNIDEIIIPQKRGCGMATKDETGFQG